jgi:tetratricopeptide (TPR) repeat protein
MEQHPHTGDAQHDADSPSYLAALVANALHAHRAGQLDEAAPLYQEALAINPIHTEALHYFGVLQHQRRNHAAAADLLDHALELQCGLLEQPRPCRRGAWAARRSAPVLLASAAIPAGLPRRAQ